MPNATKHIDGPNILTFWDVFIFKHDVSQKSLKILGPWGGVFTKMKTKNEPSILELTVSIFLCSDLPDFVPWGGVHQKFQNKTIRGGLKTHFYNWV